MCKNEINEIENQIVLTIFESLKFKYLFKEKNIKLEEYFEIKPELYDKCHSFSITPCIELFIYILLNSITRWNIYRL